MFDWMAWTTPVAVFFTSIGVMLIVMTLCEVWWPTRVRKGFLPIVTTRGDRLFIGLMAAAFSLIYFLIILLLCFILYNWMQRVGTVSEGEESHG